MVTNNKINFFVPLDFNKTEAPDQKIITSGSLQKSEKFKENAIKCLNGEYEIVLENFRNFSAGKPLRNEVDKATWF